MANEQHLLKIPDLSDLELENPDGPYRPETYCSKETMGYLLKRAWTVLANAIDQELSPYGLTFPQFVILVRLKEGECSTAAELAREVCTDTGAMTRMLDRLECKGVIRRKRSSADRRVVNLVFTESGRAVVDKVPVAAVNVLNRYFSDFTAEELTILESLLKRIIAKGG